MPFQPGQSKTPGSGRKKGTRNKRSALIGDHIGLVLTEHMQNLSKHLDRLKAFEPAAYTTAILRLLPYAVSRVAASPVTEDDDDMLPMDEPDLSVPPSDDHETDEGLIPVEADQPYNDDDDSMDD